MTFQADTFSADKDFGLRWENGLPVGQSGKAEMLTAEHTWTLLKSIANSEPSGQ
jgi:hypothetical protein